MGHHKNISGIMPSIKRTVMVLLSSRKLRVITHNAPLIVLLCVILTVSCVLHFSSSAARPSFAAALDDSVGKDSIPSPPRFEASTRVKAERDIVFINKPDDTPPVPDFEELEAKVQKEEPEIKYQNVFVPPLPVVSKKKPNKNKRKKFPVNSEEEDEEEEEESEGLIGQMFGLLNNFKKISDGRAPMMDTVFSAAKMFKDMSHKVKSVNKKISNKKLNEVQGYVSSTELKSVNEENFAKMDPPLGPEARKNAEFEELMQRNDKKPSLMQSIAQNAGPALLSAFAKGAEGGDNGSLLENLFINVGPKIIADAFASTGSGQRRSDGGSAVDIGGFGNALKLLTPLLKTVVASQQGENGDPEETDTAISSLMGLAQGLAPLIQGQGGPKTLGETIDLLKPVMNFVGPSIMEKIVVSKQHEQQSVKNKRERRNDHEDDAIQQAVNDPPEFASKGTFIDKMLKGMDEKNVGQAVGRALSGMMVNAIPKSLSLPKPSSIRSPYDLAFNMLLGNPRNDSKVMWNWLRKVSGDSQTDPTATKPAPWVQSALGMPKRDTFKEDIRHFYGLLLNVEENACRNVKDVGGVYHWKKDKILGSRPVCEDFDLWKANQRNIISFGLKSGWSFEEEMCNRGHSVVYVVEPKLGRADHNHSLDVYYYSGGLSVEPGQERRSDGELVVWLPYDGWLEKWNLTQSTLHYVKMDLGGNEWQILQSIIQKTPQHLEDVQQLSLTFYLDRAFKDPSLYAGYIDILSSLTSFGFQLFNVTTLEIPGQTYEEPFLDNRLLSLQYIVAFVRT